jgi:hypothetical protein
MMPNPLLDVCDRATHSALVPTSVELFGGDAKLNDQVVRKVFRDDLAAPFQPQAPERLLAVAHDDTRIRAAEIERGDAMWQNSLSRQDRHSPNALTQPTWGSLFRNSVRTRSAPQPIFGGARVVDLAEQRHATVLRSVE